MDRSLARHAGLLVVVFVATLVLLAGGWALVGQGGANSGSPRSSSLAGSVGPLSIASASSGALPSASGPVGSSAQDVVLTGAGDIADCSSTGAAQTSDLLVNQAGTIFTAGDNAYENGSDAEFAACYQPTWGRVKDRTLPVPGEHDYQTSGAAGYLAYFGAAAAPGRTTWYSTDLGTWHVIFLDSNCANIGGCNAASPQGRWLAADLAAHAEVRCTLAIWHHPRFSSGEHGDNVDVGSFWTQLVAAHADLVINGHDHDYERFAPQDAAGKQDRKVGLREFVVGTGGAGLRGFTSAAANSELRLAGVWGVMRLTLHPANYDWEFLPTAGQITDSGSALCH
jgi:hypothetical protein